jgi:hypothetical protein
MASSKQEKKGKCHQASLRETQNHFLFQSFEWRTSYLTAKSFYIPLWGRDEWPVERDPLGSHSHPHPVIDAKARNCEFAHEMPFFLFVYFSASPILLVFFNQL